MIQGRLVRSVMLSGQFETLAIIVSTALLTLFVLLGMSHVASRHICYLFIYLFIHSFIHFKIVLVVKCETTQHKTYINIKLKN